jgi:hypothetical protein
VPPLKASSPGASSAREARCIDLLGRRIDAEAIHQRQNRQVGPRAQSAGGRRRAQPEAELQRALCRHLEARAAPGLVWFHVPQGNKLGGKISAKGIAIQGAINGGLGVKRGVSDLIFLHDGKFYSLELKAEGRTPTTEQLEFIDKASAAGGFATWCAGLDAALRVLEAWQLLRGRTS